MNYLKETHNPVELIRKWWPEHEGLSHIVFDPDMRSGTYWRVEQCSHDGSHVFTIQMLQKALLPILNKTSCGTLGPPSHAKDVKYRIGPMRHVTVFGKVNFRCGGYSGQKERVRYPVACSYIF